MVLPSGQRSRVKSLVTYDGEVAGGVPADGGHGDARGRDRRQPRRHAGAPGQRAARRPARSRRCWCGWPRSRWRPAGSTWSSRRPTWSTASVSTLHYRVDVNTLHREDAAGAGDERSRPLHGDAEPAARGRPVPPQPHDGRVHRDRPADQPHGRRRHDPRSADLGRRRARAPGTATRGEAAREAAPTAVTSGRAGGALRPEAGHAAAHRPDGRRQVDARLRARAAAVRRRPRRRRARRPADAADHQPRSRVHGGRSLREPAPRRRRRAAAERRRPDRRVRAAGAGRRGPGQGPRRRSAPIASCWSTSRRRSTVCRARDTRGVYARADAGRARRLPGRVGAVRGAGRRRPGDRHGRAVGRGRASTR